MSSVEKNNNGDARPSRGTILYIEDNFENKLLVRRILEASGYSVLDAEDGISGVNIALERQPDLIIMDLNLPGMDGYEAATKIKSMEKGKNIPVVALTANVMKGDKERSLVAGCEGYLQKPIDPDTFVEQIEEYLKGKVEKVSLRSESLHLRKYNEKLVVRLESKIKELEKANMELVKSSRMTEDVYVGVITSLMMALEAKHHYTAGHSLRVTKYCISIGEEMNLSQNDMVHLRRAARLHDIGKLVIELSSIDNPGELTGEEWEQMRRHTEIGAQILAPLKFLTTEIKIIRDHHERYDGSGYPAGKKGDEISMLTSILAVADSYDAITTDRAYQKSKPQEEAFQAIVEQRGKQYHPDVVDALARVWNKSKQS